MGKAALEHRAAHVFSKVCPKPIAFPGVSSRDKQEQQSEKKAHVDV